MNKANRIFITDCEGPVSKNDNAFELTRHFIPEGEKLFTQISKYDDVLADIVKRRDYKAGDTLKLILPFFKAYDVTDEKMRSFSMQNILLMPGAKDATQFLGRFMPSFIVSTSYEHYIRALCRCLDFPYENTYCTKLSMDAYHVSPQEKQRLKQLGHEMCVMTLLQIPEGARSLQELSERDRNTVERLDEIFWKEITHMESGLIFKAVDPVGGVEKAKAAKEIVHNTESSPSSAMYVGDSITDVECFRLIRENGGVTVSFNGNAYAVREAEIAVLSSNSIITAVIADVFKKHGKEELYRLMDDWRQASLEKYGVDSMLQEKLQTLFPKGLPKVARITAKNMKELAVESSSFRKLVRGEEVGRLG